MESQNEIVLNGLSNYLSNDHDADIRPPEDEMTTAQQGFSLPQADGGKEAWMFLAAGFIVEALIWGKFKLFVLILNISKKLPFPTHTKTKEK